MSRLNRYVHDSLSFDVVDDGPLDGIPVVLLHGFPQSATSWELVAERLHNRGFRTLAPDQRGSSPGASPKGRRSYRIDLLTADVVALIDKLDEGPVHVMGHDWGAAVAYSLALNAPSRVTTLTSLAVPNPEAFLRAMTSSNQALRSWYMAFFQLPRLPERLVRGSTDKVVDALVRTGQTPERARRDIDHLLATGITPPINWYRALPFDVGVRNRAKVRVPTLHIYGARDTAVGPRTAELNGRFVDAPYELVVLDEVSHWIPEEVPDVVVEHFCVLVASAG